MIPAPGPDLHKAHAALNQAARDQHLVALRRAAIHVPHRRGFLAQIKRIRRLRLHAEGHFKSFQARFQLGLFLEILAV